MTVLTPTLEFPPQFIVTAPNEEITLLVGSNLSSLFSSGEKGDKGDKGDTGNKGDSIQGDKGDTGLSAYGEWLLTNTGTFNDFLLTLKGPAGNDGNDGTNGVDGVDGDDFIIDAVDLLANRGTYDNEANGFNFVASDTSDLYVRVNGLGMWSNPIPIVSGPKGDKGDKGDIGLTGDQGDPGVDATPFVFDAIGLRQDRLNYDTQNFGFSYLATDEGYFYLRDAPAVGAWSDPIPFKGDKGDKGDTGTSLYEHAIAEGFVGTLTEFIAAQKGDQGVAGQNTNLVQSIVPTETYTVSDADFLGNTVRLMSYPTAQKVIIPEGILTTQVCEFLQVGAGQLEFESQGTVVIRSNNDSLKLRKRYGVAYLIPDQTVPNLFYLTGELELDIPEPKTPKFMRYQDPTNRSFSTSWVDGMETPDFTKTSGSNVYFTISIPFRSDTTGWGGVYIEVNFSIDGGTTWESLGDYGYGHLMHNSASSISHIQKSHILTHPDIVNSSSFRIKLKHKTYSSSATIRSSNNITDGPNYSIGDPEICFLELLVNT